MAHPQLALIRERYSFQCGYCGVSEVDAGGELTTDHFIPRSSGGSDGLENLVYACMRCNINKADFAPTAEEIIAGKRILHPYHDNVTEHYSLDEETGELIALTNTGKFHIALLKLNRPQLKIHRVRTLLTQLITNQMQELQDENHRLNTEKTAQRTYEDILRTNS